MLGVIRIQLCNSSDFSSFLLWMTCFETSLYAAVGLNNRGSTVRRKFHHLLLGWVQGCLYLAGHHGEGWWVSWTCGKSTTGTDQTLLLFSVSSQHEVGAAGRLAAHGGCWEYFCARRCPGCTNGTGMVWHFQQSQCLKQALGGTAGCLCSGDTASLPSPRLLHGVLAVCTSFFPARALAGNFSQEIYSPKVILWAKSPGRCTPVRADL